MPTLGQNVKTGKEAEFETNLEASGTPVHELDAALTLDSGDGCVHVLGHNITAVEHAAGHVLAVPEDMYQFRNSTDIKLEETRIEYLGSHFTMELAGSKQALVISATLRDSW